MIQIRKDTAGWSYNVSNEPMPKRGGSNGSQKTESKTGRPMWTTQIVGLFPGEGATVLEVTTAGARPEVSVGQMVQPVDLTAIPYLSGGGTGFNGRPEPVEIAIAWRASELRVIDTPAQAAKPRSAATA
jgi:hypothetical protein